MNAKEELTKLLMESYDQGVKDGLETSLQLIKERLAQPEKELLIGCVNHDCAKCKEKNT